MNWLFNQALYFTSKKRVIKNRNDPRFWELEIQEKVLCLACLKKYQEQMPTSKKYAFNKYLQRYQALILLAWMIVAMSRLVPGQRTLILLNEAVFFAYY